MEATSPEGAWQAKGNCASCWRMLLEVYVSSRLFARPLSLSGICHLLNLDSTHTHLHMCMVYVLNTWIDGPADTSDSRQGAQEAETDSTLNNFRTRVDRNHKILWVCQERVSGNSLCESKCVCVTVCVWAKMAARQTQRAAAAASKRQQCDR